MDRRICRAIEISIVFLILGLLLFSKRVDFPGVGSSFRNFALEIDAFSSRPETQWMIYACLAVYFVTSIFPTAVGYEIQSTRRSILLLIVFIISTVLYGTAYHRASSSAHALIFLTGATAGRIAALFTNRRATHNTGLPFPYLLVFVLSFLLLLASISAPSPTQVYRYHDFIRWSGPWDNPNIFGLIMGAGLTLGLGWIFILTGMRTAKQSAEPFELQALTRSKALFSCYPDLVMILSSVAVILMARALIHSFSRGAWISTLCGLGYLIIRGFRFEMPKTREWILRNTPPLILIILAAATMAFWHFRHSGAVIPRRMFSIVDSADFSWRNRVVSWEGSLQMIADSPLAGFGWNRSEFIYDHLYRPESVPEAGAIEMNDYLMLATSLGIPALILLSIYISCTLFADVRICEKGEILRTEMIRATWFQIVCISGSIVFLVGFWFDGGLFKLPTAVTFWILLELGRSSDFIRRRLECGDRKLKASRPRRRARAEPN